MSLNAKLNDLRSKIPAGQYWYCFQVPEELHVWTFNHQWRDDALESYGVQPLRFKVHGTAEAKTERHPWTKRSPLKLKCGISIVGQKTVSLSTTHTCEGRVDSTKELNEALAELADGPGFHINSFDIKELDVITKNNVILTCCVHNPDGSGASLYTVEIMKNGTRKPYLQIPVGTMMEDIGKFQQKAAHCTNEQRLVHGCAILNRVKKNQVIRRSKS